MNAWKLTVHRDLVPSKVIPMYDSKLRFHMHAEEIKLEINLLHTCNRFVYYTNEGCKRVMSIEILKGVMWFGVSCWT